MSRKDSRLPQNQTGARGPAKRTPYRKITPALEDAWLTAFRNSGGSFSAACAATANRLNPNYKPDQINPAGASTWRRHLQSSVSFASRYDEAKQAIVDDLEELAHKLAHGVKRKVYQKATMVWENKLDENGQPLRDKNGEPVMIPAEQTFHDSRVVLARLRALAPEKYGERKTVDINHNVNRAGHWTVTALDLEALNESEQEQLANLMAKVRDHRKSMAAIEHKPAIEDAEFSEVDTSDWDSEHEPVAY